MDSSPIFDATPKGVSAGIRHIKIGEDQTVKPTDVEDWIAGFAAHVHLRLGDVTSIIDADESRVRLAARRIVENHVRGDVLDAAFQGATGRNEDPPGERWRKQAAIELNALVAEVERLRGVGESGGTTDGSVGHGFPTEPMVSRAMRF